MQEIKDIIVAANNAFTAFVAANPDREIRVSVSNAVKFLTADLTTAVELTISSQKGS